MMGKACAALLTSVSVALTLASNQAFGQSKTSHGGSSASHRVFPHHHNQRHIRTFFPAAGGFFGGSFDGLPNANVYSPTSDEPRLTCTYEIPWDWVHRCPPVAAPPEPPLLPLRAPSCASQAVTVPWADGNDRTVSIVRC